MKRSPLLILASRSPRRREILSVLGIRHRALPPGVDESRRGKETPLAHARRLALEKARAVAARRPHAPVLAADTVVHRGRMIFGTPRGPKEARRMLRILRGRRHLVTTAVCLYWKGRHWLASETTAVRFRRFSRAALERYLRSGEPYDKAGGYGIQGLGGLLLVENIAGSFSNAVGLPVEKTLRLLRRLS